MPAPKTNAALLTPRERIWQAIQRTGQRGAHMTAWTVQEACAPMVPFKTVQIYMRGLQRAGYLGEPVPSQTKRGAQRTRPEFVLVKNTFEAPRVDYDGKVATKGLGVLAMWRAMQALKSFDFRAIANCASVGTVRVSPQTARLYVNALYHAGYLKQLRAPTRQLPGLYRLIRFTGPHAPAITRQHVVLDRNSGVLFLVETEQEVCDGLE